MVLGTPAYMAPEQAMGDPIDGRSDLYSLGLVLYEMLAGELPFPTETTALLEAKERATREVPLPPLGREVPAPVRRVVLKALAPRAEDRYQTGAEMSRALRDALAIAYPSGAYPLPERAFNRRRGILLVVFVATVGVLAARACV
jgi:serine/threonine-protein kinase